MNVGSIDINLATLEIGNEQIEWHNVKEENISIHGVYFDTGAGLYIRVPDDVAEHPVIIGHEFCAEVVAP